VPSSTRKLQPIARSAQLGRGLGPHHPHFRALLPQNRCRLASMALGVETAIPAVLAAASAPVRVVVDSSPWATIAALATAAGVLVALFGPAIHRRLRRPKLTLSWERVKLAHQIRFVVTNGARRDTARGVEVHILDYRRPEPLAPQTHGDESRTEFSIQRALDWNDSRKAPDIPPGFSRFAAFFTLDNDHDLTLHTHPEPTSLIFYRQVQGQLREDIHRFPTRFAVAVVCDNAPATFYSVALHLRYWPGDMYEHKIDRAVLEIARHRPRRRNRLALRR
jgi:hypothetical protein